MSTVQTKGAIYPVDGSPNVDARWGSYPSIQAALTALGESGYDCIVSGFHFGVKNTDGTVTEYKFTKDNDSTSYVKVGSGSNGGNIADEWVSSKSYSPGAIVAYNDKFWKAKQYVSANITPTENAYWTETSIGKAISDIINNEANYIDVSQSNDKVDISLCHDDESEEISNTSIPAASASGAGVMSVDDKQTLQTLESNAPKNITVNAKESEVELKMAVVRGTDKVVSIPSATSTSSGVMSKADKVALDGVVADVERMTGLGGSNYLGIFASSSAANTAHVTYSGGADKTKVAAWCLVGEDISQLVLYTANNGGDLTAWSGKTYDFTDYQNVESKVEELSQKINGGENISYDEVDSVYGYYNTSSSNSQFYPSPHSSETIKCYCAEVNEGDKYKIYGKGDNNSVLLYAFADADKKYVGRVYEAIDSRENGIVVTIPSGVSYIVINLGDYQESTDKIYRGIRTQINGIVDAIEDLQENSLGVNDVINNLTSGGTNKPLSAEQGKILGQTLFGVTTNTESIVQSLYNTSNYVNVSSAEVGSAYTRTNVNTASSSVVLPFILNVKKGEKYKIYGKGTSSAIGLYVLTGKDSIVKSLKKTYDAKTTPIELTIAEDGYLYVNLAEYDASNDKVVKVTSTTNGGVENKVKDTISNYYNCGDLVILCGDSQVGQANQSFVSTIKEKLNCQVLSCGFGGMRYSYLRTDTSNSETNNTNAILNAFTMIEVAKALVSGNFTTIDNALANYTDASSHFTTSIANLKSAYNTIKDGNGDGVVLTIAYGGNDYWSGKSIGVHSNGDLYTMIGAQEYAIEALLGKYPRLRIIVVGIPWRLYKDDSQQPTIDSNTFTKTINGVDMTRKQYSDAIISNASEYYQLQTFDMYRRCRRNIKNALEIGSDGTHPTTEYGGKLAGDLYVSFLRDMR